MVDGYKSVSEIAEEWGITSRQVQNLCANGRIKNAGKIGNNWAIPADEKKPMDGRLCSGKYKNWRKGKSGK